MLFFSGENRRFVIFSSKEVKMKGGRYLVPVRQYTLDGVFVGEYSSIKEAWEKTHINNINKVLSGKVSQAGGFKWEKVEQPTLNPPRKKKPSTPSPKISPLQRLFVYSPILGFSINGMSMDEFINKKKEMMEQGNRNLEFRIYLGELTVDTTDDKLKGEFNQDSGMDDLMIRRIENLLREFGWRKSDALCYEIDDSVVQAIFKEDR